MDFGELFDGFELKDYRVIDNDVGKEISHELAMIVDV
jgi:hypothetical protein